MGGFFIVFFMNFIHFFHKKTNSELELVFEYMFKLIVNYKLPATAF